ncbi:beta-N-acetylhexosaminidase [Proteiniphilum saccharofermentans]|uniref:beta-N-acetylhexosaminidase n=1 Tax=Proteiniphilum saccharofermentans TaxID=1642647 RepID=A0A1R3T5C1_9BACT|nr:beta-N-acetylhexosaminidase [Proteiniphilum saccharofermentans]SCD21269.1 beta-N-acetylhexosaminidase [Proteiniphilum saccharofermentans]
MNFSKIIILVSSFYIFFPSIKSQPLHLIPYPNELELLSGHCDLSGGINCSSNSPASEQLYKYLSGDFDIVQNKKGIPVNFVTSEEIKNEEGYQLIVNRDRIIIKASAYKGSFYAIQTLRQLVKDKKIPCLHITDEPQFLWRGYMLDEARHFHGKETVKRILDDMALLKMNTFHWHLTDDAGWRIEIRKYPLLTEIGSRRDSTQIEDKDLIAPPETGDPAYDAFLRRYKSEKFDNKPHSGHYSQEEIREIVKYAEGRCIKIVPEISMPGHASAAIASYPWLGTTKKPIGVPCKFGVMTQVYDPSSPEVIQFFKDVLREVNNLFPSGYIHIGGDEVKFDQWQASQSIQQYMKENDLKNYRDIQIKLTNDICTFIEEELGKQMVGWNEILGINPHQWQKEVDNSHVELSKNAIVQFWAGNKDILSYAINNGYKIIHTFSQDTYIDYSYEQLPLERAYNFSPVPDGYAKESILGLGCQMWTEWIRNRKDLEYHTYPRIAAYAETGWTAKEKKSYDRFKSSLNPLLTHWRDKGYNLPKIDF